MTKFNNCIAIGVQDMHATAERFCQHLGGHITDRADSWIEVTAGPIKFYFVEDGTNDIAFSVDVVSADLTLRSLQQAGFTDIPELKEKTGEHFVRDPDGILINLHEVGSGDS
ncbi:VOC family protein [Kamptonema cortianum]|nr:VOC family protein [Geitlerinema splendidum]MDK3158455.1 VOC family protein [Kamptonema cortianum]